MKIVAISTQKGGTAKTTSTVNLGACLTRAGKRVMLVDMDPQGHLSISLGINETKGIEEVLLKKQKPDEVIVEKEGMSIIPIGNGLAENKVLKGDYQEEFRKEIRGLDLDWVLFDCPPHFGFLTTVAFYTATDIIIPVKCDFLALKSIEKVQKLHEIISIEYNNELSISGILPTFYQSNIVLYNDVLEMLKKKFERIVLPPIRINVSLAEASLKGKSIFEYDKKSHGAEDYKRVCDKLLGDYYE